MQKEKDQKAEIEFKNGFLIVNDVVELTGKKRRREDRYANPESILK